MTSIIEELTQRELIQDVTDPAAVSALPSGTPCYVGFDPTAPYLHIGNLVPLKAAMHLGKAGFVPLILFGGATGAIGDPSGRNSERPLLSREEIQFNVERHQEIVRGLFDRAGVSVTFLNNFDWTREVLVLDFLRDVGKYFTVNYMLGKDSVRNRLEGAGLSFTELSYMLLQAFDFYHLYTTKGCKLQLGGSDQWGNITSGLELIRKKAQGEAYGMSFPLITDSEGKKFGKSTGGGAAWLNPEATSPYLFHQFWFNQSDNDAIRYLRIFTFLSLEKIEEIQKDFLVDPGKRLAQRVLADEVCTLVHGPEATQEANKCREALFGGSLASLTGKQLSEIFSGAPSHEIALSELLALSFIDLFSRTGAVKSKGEARRLMTEGGAYMNNERLSEGETKIGDSTFAALLTDRPYLVLRTGKKNYTLVRILIP